jgi:ribonuclease HI
MARDEHMKLVDEYKTNPNTLYIYSDGSKRFDSGFFRCGASAVAYILGNEIENGKLGLGGHAEVFDAEMAALAKAASLASDLIRDFPNLTHIAFFSDNSSAVRAITDPKPSSAQYFTLSFINHIRPLLETHHNLAVSVSWCPSHCDIPGNERADALAKEATSLGCQLPFSTTRSNAKRRAKANTAKAWQKEWKNSTKEGRFAIANRLKPSLNPTNHFIALKDKWEIFGRVLQCRTGHAFTGEFRQAFLPLSPEPNTCPCNNSTMETRNHILRDCPRYNEHRNILIKASKYISLPEVLGTKKGIEASYLYVCSFPLPSFVY